MNTLDEMRLWTQTLQMYVGLQYADMTRIRSSGSNEQHDVVAVFNQALDSTKVVNELLRSSFTEKWLEIIRRHSTIR